MKRRKKLDKATEARRRARQSAPKASGTRVIADKRKKAPKHKRNLVREAEDS